MRSLHTAPILFVDSCDTSVCTSPQRGFKHLGSSISALPSTPHAATRCPEKETAAWRRRFAYLDEDQLTKRSKLVFVFPSPRPEHPDTTVSAVREDVVGRQGDERLVVMAIDGNPGGG